MKIVTVVGARPQFVKAAVVSRAIRHSNKKGANQITEVLLHTGQHYDENMSQVFFDDLDIPRPDYNLAVRGGTHGLMTGQMLEKIESVLLIEKPDWVLIYGDTNSTLAAALAAVKLHVPVAHVEAGLRSFNMRMPEEVNRILSDKISTLLFCPTQTAVQNLKAEGIDRGVLNVGDVMYDASLFYRDLARKSSSILMDRSLVRGEYVLVTCHRAENTDDSDRLSAIVDGLARLAEKVRVLFPLHPRTRKALESLSLFERLGNVEILEPLSFIDMIQLEESAKVIVTDSGGVQKEACFFSVPCITMRDETEWVETIEAGANVLVGADAHRLLEAFDSIEAAGVQTRGGNLYGDGKASEYIVRYLLESRGAS